MNDRQESLLRYHADVAAFASDGTRPVFVILDLEDPDALEIAQNFEPDVAEKRDAIKETNAIPAYTMCLSIADANQLIASGWPNLRRIGAIPDGFVPVLLFSCQTCLSAFLPK